MKHPVADSAAFPVYCAPESAAKKDVALKEAERLTMLYPRAKDPQAVPSLEENMAVIQTILGENSHAISTVTRLLQTPYDSPMYPFALTPALLRFDPLWGRCAAIPLFKNSVRKSSPESR
jgi:hypothetical protein